MDGSFLNPFELTGTGDELGVMWEYFPTVLFSEDFWGEGSAGGRFSECWENRQKQIGKVKKSWTGLAWIRSN